MNKLIEHFHFKLDNILSKYKVIKHQEGLVMIENSILFNSPNKISIIDVVNYGNNSVRLKNFQFLNHSMQKIN